MPELDPVWLLLIAPLAFGLGWLASRFDRRQREHDRKEQLQPYYRGLYLLLSDQQDKAIDAFITSTQNDVDSSDLHFALGKLLRKRGEYERAVRVHEHLLGRPQQDAADRDKAQFELGLDYMSAGLYDRAEAAFEAASHGSFATDARLEGLALSERTRDWPRASQIAQQLEDSAAGSFHRRMAHHACEQAQEAQARGDTAQRLAQLERAVQLAPDSPRPRWMQGDALRDQGDLAAALDTWLDLLPHHPEAFALKAVDAARTALELHASDPERGLAERSRLLQTLEAQYAAQPAFSLIEAWNLLDADSAAASERVRTHFLAHTDPASLMALLQIPPETWVADCGPLVRREINRLAQSQQRHGCVACGFESQRHFWQCPGCSSWDSMPLQAP
ncbi:lipopolysaccharide assembly protein LapB [Amphibiibacter pelophylacis]|uniref:Tetratricopeptide repeat protein n=1 Tax=Amphibiibacter pelophylacis TaxID=1799477 RepID=A0ACC6P2M9_9BURK